MAAKPTTESGTLLFAVWLAQPIVALVATELTYALGREQDCIEKKERLTEREP